MKFLNIITLTSLAVGALSSCSQDEQLTLGSLSIDNSSITVDAFPAFNSDLNSRSAAIGTYDAGKTEWVKGDQIYLELIVTDSEGQTSSSRFHTLTYDGSEWTSNDEIVVSANAYNDNVKYIAYYAPKYTISDNTLTCTSGANATGEYLTYESETVGYKQFDGKISITFNSRNYSRLRIACGTASKLSVTFKGFTPVSGSATSSNTYTVTPDSNGNAYLYGTWTEDSSLSIGTSVKGITFGASSMPASVNGKSYAFDATTATINLTTMGGFTTAKTRLKTFADNNSSVVNYKVIGKNEFFADNYENIFCYTVSSKTISIPAETIDMTGMSFTKVLDSEFRGISNLKKVLLPNTVTEIEQFAFAETAINEFVFSDNITTLGVSIFCDCKNLESVVLPKGITLIPDNMFQNCTSLKDIEIPANVITIGICAFQKTALTTVIIPESVKTIGNSAFNQTNLTTVTIGKSVTSVGLSAFSGCKQLNTVICLSETAPALKTNVASTPFTGCPEYMVLYIPKGARSSYNYTYWEDYFKEIKEMD
jgi:hypothetical protein